ncbi:uncharacterized protein LOC126677575 [Mercurialis annua]|uniref:uncharacterized protein LOC126677575 n=1 Tax=Mercurialis annua TaxID=3986 RepID=UPI0024AEE9F3|nr:uncharacterized protein LOC126677575 [Mercurialis annua]
MPESVSRKRKTFVNSSAAASRDQSGDDVWSRPNWPPRLEKVFVELLMDEMNIYVDVCATGFNEKAWDHVTQEFNKETGLHYDKMELKKHLALLKKRYRIVKPLYDHGGFGWDYRRKMVDVDDDVWKEYIEVHPQIKPYRKWGCPIYEELCTLFTKPIATGEYAMSPAEYGLYSSSTNSRSQANVNGRNNAQSAGHSSSGPNKRNAKGATTPGESALPVQFLSYC